MDSSIESFLRGVLAVAPEAPVSELVLAGLQYHNHGLKEAVLELGPTSRQRRADGATTVLARQNVLRRLAEVPPGVHLEIVRFFAADAMLLSHRWASTRTTSSTSSMASSPSIRTPRLTTFSPPPSVSLSARSNLTARR